ncbi:hypothetical protein BDZ88DRAFT_36804 [Geranomyces variabilis]|nr:hypothetical protein BDZ88DRAFT_36804 [Geranomyces variabilis]KAJ3131264.1 SUMO1 sentrin specific peptidase 8 [Geranomyces variabilis]
MPANIGETELVFLPINDGDGGTGGGTHWSLLVYHRAARTFYIYDSMASRNDWHATRTIHRFSELVILSAPPKVLHIPGNQQANSSDCGVFVCAMMEELAQSYLSHRESGPSSKEVIEESLTRLTAVGLTPPGRMRSLLKERIKGLAGLCS